MLCWLPHLKKLFSCRIRTFLSKEPATKLVQPLNCGSGCDENRRTSLTSCFSLIRWRKILVIQSVAHFSYNVMSLTQYYPSHFLSYMSWVTYLKSIIAWMRQCGVITYLSQTYPPEEQRRQAKVRQLQQCIPLPRPWRSHELPCLVSVLLVDHSEERCLRWDGCNIPVDTLHHRNCPHHTVQSWCQERTRPRLRLRVAAKLHLPRHPSLFHCQAQSHF